MEVAKMTRFSQELVNRPPNQGLPQVNSQQYIPVTLTSLNWLTGSIRPQKQQHAILSHSEASFQ